MTTKTFETVNSYSDFWS